MRIIKSIVCTFFLIFNVVSCISNQPYSEFVKTVNFSNLDTFTFKHTLLTGLEFSKVDRAILENLSENVIASELSSRGFQSVSPKEGADFYAVVTWKKAVSVYSNPSDHIDPYALVLARKDDNVGRFTSRFNLGRFTSRLNLQVELYDSGTDEVFWRNELPNIFDALQLTEDRVLKSLKLAIKGFPLRIIKDPKLPTIQ